MAKIYLEKPFSKKWLISYSLILIGSFILAAGFVFFITPYQFVPGGVYGVAIVIHYLTKDVFAFAPGGLPVGLTGLVLNIPLTLIGIRVLGPRFGAKTVVGFVLSSLFMDLITNYWGDVPLVEDDPLLSCIFGGVLVGFGLGLIFRSKATSGGSDIIAMILEKYTRLPLGMLMIYVDSAIVLIGLAAFGNWAVPLYSWIVIFITGKVIDVVMQGISSDKALFIISDKYTEIRDRIITDMGRGGTYLTGQGMYNGAPRTVIYTVVNRREISILEEYIHEVDPDAFVSVIEANEILGEGFKSLQEKVKTI